MIYELQGDHIYLMGISWRLLKGREGWIEILGFMIIGLMDIGMGWGRNIGGRRGGGGSRIMIRIMI